MNTNERIELVRQAIELINEAQDFVDKAVSGTDLEAHYEAYGKYGFQQLLGTGNPYNSSLNTIIEELNNKEN